MKPLAPRIATRIMYAPAQTFVPSRRTSGVLGNIQALRACGADVVVVHITRSNRCIFPDVVDTPFHVLGTTASICSSSSAER